MAIVIHITHAIVIYLLATLAGTSCFFTLKHNLLKGRLAVWACRPYFICNIFHLSCHLSLFWMHSSAVISVIWWRKFTRLEFWWYILGGCQVLWLGVYTDDCGGLWLPISHSSVLSGQSTDSLSQGPWVQFPVSVGFCLFSILPHAVNIHLAYFYCLWNTYLTMYINASPQISWEPIPTVNMHGLTEL